MDAMYEATKKHAIRFQEYAREMATSAQEELNRGFPHVATRKQRQAQVDAEQAMIRLSRLIGTD